MADSKIVQLGEIDGMIDKPFVLRFFVEAVSPDGATNRFADTCATLAGVDPSTLPAGETIGTTGYPGETADTTWS